MPNELLIVFQLLSISSLIAYFILMVAALNFLTRQPISRSEMIIWGLIVMFVPLGALLPQMVFSANEKKKR